MRYQDQRTGELIKIPVNNLASKTSLYMDFTWSIPMPPESRISLFGPVFCVILLRKVQLKEKLGLVFKKASSVGFEIQSEAKEEK
jgi:hypothetical protein